LFFSAAAGAERPLDAVQLMVFNQYIMNAFFNATLVPENEANKVVTHHLVIEMCMKHHVTLALDAL